MRWEGCVECMGFRELLTIYWPGNLIRRSVDIRINAGVHKFSKTLGTISKF
jgi:hypothetical protein